MTLYSEEQMAEMLDLALKLRGIGDEMVDRETALIFVGLGLFSVSEAIAQGLAKLGLADAATPMGAMEVLSKEVKEGFERLSQALNGIAGAIEEDLT